MSQDDVSREGPSSRSPDTSPVPGVPLLERYTRVVVQRNVADDAQHFLGRVPAIPGCYVVGRDREEVLEALAARALERLESLLMAGQPLPEPDLPPGFGGMVIDRTE